MLINSGADIKAVSELMGHSDIKVTLDTYHHVMKEQRQDAVQRLEDFF